MKKLFKVVLVAGFIFFTGNLASAQTKIAYVDFNGLIDQMPDTKVISKNLQDYQKSFMDVLTGMQTELQTKDADYQAKRASMTDAVRQQKESELVDIQKRMQDYQQKASQQVEAKRNELGKPLFDKVKAVISAVAKEKGYSYVLDSSQTNLLVSPPADDLMASVKLKLGLK
jgi:outer membrane protein